MRIIIGEDNLVSPEEGLAKLRLDLAGTVESEEIGVWEAAGRVSAELVKAHSDLPPFNRSAVDGFALNHKFSPGSFKVIGKISIGEEPKFEISGNEAVEVDTGSALPFGATAVVKVEEVEQTENQVKVKQRVNLGYNVAWIGDDIVEGETILLPGEIISPTKMSLLGSLGVSKVKVIKAPRIFIVSTGSELVEPGSPIPLGKVYESNSLFVKGEAEELGAKVVGRVLVKDDYGEVKAAILRGVEEADLVIAIGGTSAGEKDLVHRAIMELGEIKVHGINLKPGKPAILGVVKGKPVFGLPGNPVSSIVIFKEVVSKYLAESFGLVRSFETTIKATAMAEIRADKRRVTIQPVIAMRKDQEIFIHPLPFESHMIGTYALSDGYVKLQPGQVVNEGESTEATLSLSNLNRHTLIGEEEPSLQVPPSWRRVYFGSVIACNSLKYGVGDILVISAFVCEPKKYDKVLDRDLVEMGQGEEIGYMEWIGMSRVIKDPKIRVKSPRVALKLTSQGRVIVPSTFGIKGRLVATERIYILGGFGERRTPS
jgi:molybdopterin molybdotransferase